jgi:hypothetical protein
VAELHRNGARISQHPARAKSFGPRGNPLTARRPTLVQICLFGGAVTKCPGPAASIRAVDEVRAG